jgi:hypothetical protein
MDIDAGKCVIEAQSRHHSNDEVSATYQPTIGESWQLGGSSPLKASIIE